MTVHRYAIQMEAFSAHGWTPTPRESRFNLPGPEIPTCGFPGCSRGVMADRWCSTHFLQGRAQHR